jgi:iron(III) transport system permease protein
VAFWQVVVPMLRPAIAGGAAVVAMETLTDFATVQYFQLDTVTVGVFQVWRGTYDRDGASELASLVLVFALVAIALERALRGRARFAEAGGRGPGFERRRLRGPSALGATALGSLVVAVAFGLPALRLATWAYAENRSPRGTPATDRYVEFLGNSAVLTAWTVAVCVAVAVLIANAGRFSRSRLVAPARQLASAGYAVPGPVIAMGVVLTLVALDQALGHAGVDLPGVVATGSFIGLVYAYAIRFTAPALSSVDAGLDRVPPDLTASARSLGVPATTVVGRIHLPLSRAGITTAAILVAVDALKELPIALLLRPIGFDTLSIWTYGLATESRFEQAALPALTIVAAALVPVVILTRGLDRKPSVT